MSYGTLNISPSVGQGHIGLQPEYAGSYAKIAAITLLPAIIGGVVGYRALAKRHGVGATVGVILLPILTLLAVNAMPGGVSRFVAP